MYPHPLCSLPAFATQIYSQPLHSLHPFTPHFSSRPPAGRQVSPPPQYTATCNVFVQPSSPRSILRPQPTPTPYIPSLLPTPIPAHVLHRLAKHLQLPNILQPPTSNSCHRLPFSPPAATYFYALQPLPAATPLPSSHLPAAHRASPPLPSTLILHLPFLTPPPLLAFTPNLLPPASFPFCCHPLFQLPPSSISVSIPKTPIKSIFLHSFLDTATPSSSPGQTYCHQLHFFLLLLPFPALALQQLDKRLHSPTHSLNPLPVRTPTSSPPASVYSQPLHFLPAATPPFGFLAPICSQPLQFLPAATSPSAPTLKKLPKHLHGPDLLPPRLISLCCHPPFQLLSFSSSPSTSIAPIYP